MVGNGGQDDAKGVAGRCNVLREKVKSNAVEMEHPQYAAHDGGKKLLFL